MFYLEREEDSMKVPNNPIISTLPMTTHRPETKQHLSFDVRDAAGRLIAAKGACFEPALLREVAQKGRPVQSKMRSLARTKILKKAAEVMQEPIYRVVFSDSKVRKKILAVMAQVKIQTGLYDEIMRLRRLSYFTYRHFILVSVLSTKMALDLKEYQYDPKIACRLALTHDIGKVWLPMEVLNKKEALTSHEYHIIHSYSILSVLLLAYYLGEKRKEAVSVAYGHHEKLDGSGYPKGIKVLSKYTKIVAVIDVFDALVADRPYRKRPFTIRGALDKLILEMHAGQLPKPPVKLLVSYFRKGQPDYRPLKLSLKARDKDPEGNNYGVIRD